MEATVEILAYAERAEAEAATAQGLAELDQVRVVYLGSKGKITVGLKGIGKLAPEARPAFGQAANQARARAEGAITARREQLEAEEAARRAAAGQVDVTLPGRGVEVGHQHPLSLTVQRVLSVFIGMGCEVMLGPEVEWSDLNFTALNYPPDHPAMDEQDSFYVTEAVMLRTHTSPAQIRAMRAHHAAECPVRAMDWRRPPLETLAICHCAPPPMRAVVPGRTYRREAVTLTHNDIFHQLECLVIGPGITFGDLKGTMTTFVHEFFGARTQVRFRPDFFPFTEPSADFSVTCQFCFGEGCRFCKLSGWVEIGGSGLVHPNVLRAGGYDPERVSGFAFGFGLERLAQWRYSIEHIRTLYDNDMRFLRQF